MDEGNGDEGNGAERRWRVPLAQPVVKAVTAVAFAVVAASSLDDPPFLLLALVAAGGLAALALRDAIAPVRVAADDDAVTVVSGYAGRRRVPWPSVREIRVDERRRLLHRTRLLEIETDDDLYLFSAFDLGADVRDAAGELERLRARADR
ncbi:PH domain-containing protein [Actinomadura sp. NBRC 104412]|uniref:PH domain-containing protein n=1 Tax=Actinomadura sp. NBRC 104412 TaxID=3032203 RepID=UPI002557C401|nr:PH domain-containing protein [Actinomadura sp. NBRC 104412]